MKSSTVLSCVRRILVALAAIVCIAECQALAEPDALKLLLDNKPKCSDWSAISRLTREQLRKSVAVGAAVDSKVLELSFVMLDFCLKQREIVVGTAGLTGGELAAQRAARMNAALFAYYKQALAATEPPTALKSWPYLAQAANNAAADLQVIIDRQFGEGAYLRYLAITSKPEQSRTADEQKVFAAMHPWMEPL